MATSGRALAPRRESDVVRGLSQLYGTGRRRTDSWTSPSGSGGGRRRHRSSRRPLLVTGAAAVVLTGGLVAIGVTSRPELDVQGITDGQQVTRRDLAELVLRIDRSGMTAGDVRVEINGTAVPVVEEAGSLVARPAEARDALVGGENRLVVTVDGRFVLGGDRVERTFTFDPTGPRLSLPAQIAEPDEGTTVQLRGLVDDSTSVTANGQPVTLEPGGAFTIDVGHGSGRIEVVAVDGQGNPDQVDVEVTREPALADYPDTAAVHVTAKGWADPAIRRHIVALARAGRINAVELDVKDETGEVGYATGVPLAARAGAVGAYYDARTAIDDLHALDVRVIGRIVCFLDPTLAGWAWDNGRPEMVVQAGAGGAPLDNGYGQAAFTNPADRAVRQYQIDLAVEAAGLGFDEILYDYVRRPEGDLGTMTFAGLTTTPEVAVARFVASTRDRLADTGARLGISVFGIAATRPTQIGQDIALLAPNVDYVSPMVYPSHWGAGEYGVADPVRQPADIVGRSVADFQRVVAGSGAAVVPWLQDFSSGAVEYGRDEVTAQISASAATGSPGFLLWNADSTYHAGALPTRW